MKLSLLLLSVVALSTAAPQNYTSHFQIFHVSTTDPTPSSTNSTINADDTVTATETTLSDDSTSTTEVLKFWTSDVTHSTDGATSTTDSATSSTESTSDFKDGITSSTGGAVETTTEATDVKHGTSNSTNGVKRLKRGVTNATTGVSKVTDDRTESSIRVMAGSDVTNEKGESNTKVVFDATTEEVNDEIYTDASIKTEGVGTTTVPPIDYDRTGNQGTSTKIGSGVVEEPGFGFTFKLPSFFTTFLQTVPTFVSARSNSSSDTSITAHRNGASDLNSHPQSFNGGRISDRSTTTSTVSPFTAVSVNTTRLSGAQNSIVPSSSIDTASSNTSFPGINFFSTSDFYDQKTPLRPEHSARSKKALTESEREERERSHEAIDYSGLHLNPDYYVPPFTSVGRNNWDAYDYDYYLQPFPAVETPEEYEENYSHSGNDGGFSGHFQYIIRTSNLPGELTSFLTSSSLSTLHPNSPDTYSSQGASSTGSQTDVGHVLLASQTESNFSLFPAFQSFSNFNFTPNHLPSFGLPTHLGGSFITNADTTFQTQKPVETHNSTTNSTSLVSEMQRPEETYFSTTTEASITLAENDQTLSAMILESSNNATSSTSTPNSSQLDSSKVSTDMVNGAELVTTTAEGISKKETSNPTVGTKKPAKNS